MKTPFRVALALSAAVLVPACGSQNDDGNPIVVFTPSTGLLDAGFGTNGIVTTDIGSLDQVAEAIAIQGDGKIVVAGYTDNGANFDFAVVRYKPDGTPDADFGGDGIVTTPVGTGTDYAFAVAVQSDGKIVAAGTSYDGTSDNFAVVRYNANGTLDTDFDVDGIVVTDIGSATTDRAYAMALQTDGKIVVVGNIFSTTDDWAVVRYNTDGSLDTDFGTGGKAVFGIGDSNDSANAVAVQSEGKIVIAGQYFTVANGNDAAVARLKADGTADPDFGTGGIVTTAVSSTHDGIEAVALQTDGKILIAGYAGGVTERFAVIRYNANGTLDPDFGSGGIATTAIGSSYDDATAIALQPDGRIVAVGFSMLANENVAVVRYWPDGTPDATFGGGDGIVTTGAAIGFDGALAVALQPDGAIVVAGYGENGTDLYDIVLARYR